MKYGIENEINSYYHSLSLWKLKSWLRLLKHIYWNTKKSLNLLLMGCTSCSNFCLSLYSLIPVKLFQEVNLSNDSQQTQFNVVCQQWALYCNNTCHRSRWFSTQLHIRVVTLSYFFLTPLLFNTIQLPALCRVSFSLLDFLLNLFYIHDSLRITTVLPTFAFLIAVNSSWCIQRLKLKRISIKYCHIFQNINLGSVHQKKNNTNSLKVISNACQLFICLIRCLHWFWLCLKNSHRRKM